MDIRSLSPPGSGSGIHVRCLVLDECLVDDDDDDLSSSSIIDMISLGWVEVVVGRDRADFLPRT